MTDKCRSCAQAVKWVRMSTGGRMLVNLPAEKRVVLTDHGDPNQEVGEVLDTYTSHFVTCPKANEHRRNR